MPPAGRVYRCPTKPAKVERGRARWSRRAFPAHSNGGGGRRKTPERTSTLPVELRSAATAGRALNQCNNQALNPTHSHPLDCYRFSAIDLFQAGCKLSFQHFIMIGHCWRVSSLLCWTPCLAARRVSLVAAGVGVTVQLTPAARSLSSALRVDGLSNFQRHGHRIRNAVAYW
jgi:hypothetical protein